MTPIQMARIFVNDAASSSWIFKAVWGSGFDLQIHLYSTTKGHLPFGRHVTFFDAPKNPAMMERLLQFQEKHPEAPILWCLPKKHPARKRIVCDELHEVIEPRCSRKRFQEALKRLAQVGRWSLPSSQTSVDPIVEPLMFDTIDLSEILKQIVEQLSALVNCRNIRWVIADQIPLLLTEKEEIVILALENHRFQSPQFYSLAEDGAQDFLKVLRANVTVSQFQILASGQALHLHNARYANALDMCFKVSSLGMLYFEGVDHPRPEQLQNRIQAYLARTEKYLEFGYDHWKAVTMSYADDLTGLYNQKYLPVAIDREIQRASRMKKEFAVLFLDLDYFKQVNDTKGHWIGSRLLAAFGQLLKENIRSCDFGFRYGGDEFVLLLMDTGALGGQIVAERIRKRVEEFRFLVDGSEVRLTVSIGLAVYPGNAKTSQQIIKMADQAMYRGKHKSRNIVYKAS